MPYQKTCKVVMQTCDEYEYFFTFLILTQKLTFNLFLLSFSSVNLLYPLLISTYSTVPEFKDPVFFFLAKTSRKRSFSMIECERFGLVFANTGFINSGTVVSKNALIFSGGLRCNTEVIFTVQYNILECFFRNHSSPVLAKIVVRKLPSSIPSASCMGIIRAGHRQ